MLKLCTNYLTRVQNSYTPPTHRFATTTYKATREPLQLQKGKEKKQEREEERPAAQGALARRVQLYHYSTAFYPLGGAYLIQVKGLGGGRSQKQRILWGEARILGWHARETLSAHGWLRGGSSPRCFGWVDGGWMCGRADGWVMKETRQSRQRTKPCSASNKHTAWKCFYAHTKNPALNAMLVQNKIMITAQNTEVTKRFSQKYTHHILKCTPMVLP